MRYTVTLHDEDFKKLYDVVMGVPNVEGAAYLICGHAATDREFRFLVREVVPVRDEHYKIRSGDLLSLASESFVQVAKSARGSKATVIFCHSHPFGPNEFSAQDDREEKKLHEFFAKRLPGTVTGSLVVAGPNTVRGRCWVNGSWEPIERVRVIGNRYLFLGADSGQEEIPQFFDRQVRAFGQEIQRLLGRLHIGVAGVGGTGSAVTEQLVRLGVGELSIYDGDSLALSNVNRVYGSCAADKGRNKAKIQGGHIHRIGVGTKVNVFTQPITELETARSLRNCDLVFGCTDLHRPRGILTSLAYRYHIPVIDLGVVIKSKDEKITGVYGRATTLRASEPCLFCRGGINSETIQAECLSDEVRAAQAKEGYVPELGDPAPAVIPFTTMIAGEAVALLLHRLTGFMGIEREYSEFRRHFHEGKMHSNSGGGQVGCPCSDRNNWGKGDSRDFLGMTW